MSANKFFNRFSEFPRNHRDITALASDTDPLPTPMLVYCGSAGDIAVVDQSGEELIYTVEAGAIIPIVVSQIKATGTDVTQIIGLY